MEIETTNSLHTKQMNFNVDIYKLHQHQQEMKQRKQSLTTRTFEIIKVSSVENCHLSRLSDLSSFEQPQIFLTNEQLSYFNQLETTQNIPLSYQFDSLNNNINNNTDDRNQIGYQTDIQIENNTDQIICFVQPSLNDENSIQNNQTNDLNQINQMNHQSQLFDNLIIRTFNFCNQYQHIHFQVTDESLIILEYQNNHSLIFKLTDEIDSFLQFPKPLLNSLFSFLFKHSSIIIK